jgi:hypothetical protein
MEMTDVSGGRGSLAYKLRKCVAARTRSRDLPWPVLPDDIMLIILPLYVLEFTERPHIRGRREDDLDGHDMIDRLLEASCVCRRWLALTKLVWQHSFHGTRRVETKLFAAACRRGLIPVVCHYLDTQMLALPASVEMWWCMNRIARFGFSCPRGRQHANYLVCALLLLPRLSQTGVASMLEQAVWCDDGPTIAQVAPFWPPNARLPGTLFGDCMKNPRPLSRWIQLLEIGSPGLDLLGAMHTLGFVLGGCRLLEAILACRLRFHTE